MEKKWSLSTAAVMVAGLVLTGCASAGPEAESEPTPTVTVTETPEAQAGDDAGGEDRQLSADHEWLAESMEKQIDILDMRELLVAAGIDCPNDQSDEIGMLIECGSSEHDTMIIRPYSPGVDDRIDGFDSDSYMGVIATENFAIVTDNTEVVSKAGRALDLLSPSVEESWED